MALGPSPPATARARTRAAAVAAGLITVAFGYVLAEGYKNRLADPRGTHLVTARPGQPVAAVPVQPASRVPLPRHIIFVVVDGLRADAALRMRATAWMQEHGTCRRTDVGTLTMSRPVYALLSSGVEPARSGVRGNDQHTPAPVESIWQVARRAGLRVTARSPLAWWRELFPDGFDDDRLLEGSTTVIPDSPHGLGDLALIHPVSVDDAGHDHGGASSQYGEAVLRVDAELLPLLEGMDATRDTLIMTADHGHTDRGGHGSGAPELRNVLTCAAGLGVRHVPSTLDPAIDARALPGLLAVLAGLPLPRHMQLDHGDLDLLLEILDPAAITPARVTLYRREIEERRAAAEAQLSAWLGEPHASWETLASHERRAQLTRFAATVAAGLLVVLAVAIRRHRSLAAALEALGWTALVLSGTYAATVMSRGGFDLAAVRTRVSFVTGTLLTVGLLVAVTGVLHLRRWRSPDRLLFDGVLLASVELVLAVAHIVGFGWTIGFPLPPPALLFLPYPLAVTMAATGGALVIAGAALAVQARRRRTSAA